MEHLHVLNWFILNMMYQLTCTLLKTCFYKWEGFKNMIRAVLRD